jgi:AraC-like DNA-binding protein
MSSTLSAPAHTLVTELAAGIEDFVERPIGRAVLDGSWLYFYPHPGFCGFVMWGHPQPAEVERLRVVLQGLLGPNVPRHAAFADTRRVVQMTPQAFDVLASYVNQCREDIGQKIERVGVVRPDGFLGAAAEGFFQMVAAPYPVSVFDSMTDALAWLGEDPAYADELVALHERATNTPRILRELQAVLAVSFRTADLSGAARTLGMSARVLQRQLTAVGTSFRQELHLVQVRAAERLLLDTDQPVTAIAYAVGCATPAHFSELFRRVRGETPSGWRARHATVRPGGRS